MEMVYQKENPPETQTFNCWLYAEERKRKWKFVNENIVIVALICFKWANIYI